MHTHTAYTANAPYTMYAADTPYKPTQYPQPLGGLYYHGGG